MLRQYFRILLVTSTLCFAHLNIAETDIFPHFGNWSTFKPKYRKVQQFFFLQTERRCRVCRKQTSYSRGFAFKYWL